MKAILVLDMPETCADCDLCFECRDCMSRPEDIPYDIEKFAKTFSDDRMPWCPLHSLPKRCEELDILKAPTVASYAQGWNECLDAITGGRNETD